MLSVAVMAGEHDLVWDYTEQAPQCNPDRGLQFGNIVNDAPGEKNGLKGIKLNSSGWCCFTKAPVAGVLKLTFGPRSGDNRASLQVFTWSGEQPKTKQRRCGERWEAVFIISIMLPFRLQTGSNWVPAVSNTG